MSLFTEYEITEAMIKYGGGFIRQLGMLYRYADFDNKKKIREAFPEYWKEYTELAEFKNQSK